MALFFKFRVTFKLAMRNMFEYNYTDLRGRMFKLGYVDVQMMFRRE